MKRLIVWATRLYPRPWRDRYGSEFEALLEDTKASSAQQLFDVLKGAFIVRLSKSPLPIIGTFTLAGTLSMVVVWALIPNIYRSQGTFAIPTAATLETINEAAADALDHRQLQTLMHKYGVDSPDDIELSKKRIAIFNVPLVTGHTGEQIVGVHFDDHDPAKAQAVAKEIMDRLALRLNAKGITTNVIEAPQHPSSPVAPALKKLLEMGVPGGLVCGLLAAIIRKRFTLATPGAS